MGVPIYMSPQILSKNYYTYKCDVWSLGIIIHEIVFGEVPWKVKEADQLFFDIMSDPEPYVRRKGVNVVVREILKGTLRYLESDRMDWEKLIELRSLV